MANVGPPSPTPGKRDPRTLGNDAVASPTGTPTGPQATQETAQQRQAVFDEGNQALIGALRSVVNQMRGVNSNTFDEFRENTQGNFMVQFKRAMDPRYDRNLERRFQVSQTSQLVSLSNQLTGLVAQLRQNDPRVDQMIKALVKQGTDAAAEQAAVVRNEAIADIMMDQRQRNGTLPVDPAAQARVRDEFLSALQNVPSPEQALDSRIKLQNIIRNMPLTEADRTRFPGFEASVDAGLKDQEFKRRQAISRSGGKKNYTEAFMDPIKLTTKYGTLVEDELDMLTEPMQGVPKVIRGQDLRDPGVVSSEVSKLPATPEMIDAAKMFALNRYKEWVAYNVTDKFVEQSVQVLIDELAIPQVVADSESIGERPPEFWSEFRKDVREMSIINLKAIADVEADRMSIRPRLPQNQ